jgi:hypothetical protein
MAAFPLIAAQILIGSFDATGFSGSVQTAPAQAAMKDVTNMGSGGFQAVLPSIKSYGVDLAGFADFTGTGINTAFGASALGTQYLVSVNPTGGAAAGDTTVFTRGLLTNFTPLQGPTGDPAGFVMHFDSDTAEVQNGQIAGPLLARTVTANGAVLTMTGPLATQRIYAGLHITAASGASPTLDCKIQSATTGGFGSPTDRITFTQATVPGWQFLSLAGAVTDGFWRAVFTIAGGSPSFTCAVVLGVA